MGPYSLPVAFVALLAVQNVWAIPFPNVTAIAEPERAGRPGRPGSNNRQGKVSLMDITPEFPHDPNTEPECRWWWDNDGSLTCEEMPKEWRVKLSDFLRWNPSITPSCGNFVTGQAYCVEGPTYSDEEPEEPEEPTKATTAAATTTQSGNGIKTPPAIQPGMVKDCNKFHPVTEKTTCKALLEYNKITMADFFKWNPDVGADCSNLWANTNACVGVIGGGGTPTTTAPGNGVSTPASIQTGMVKNCNKFHPVTDKTTCKALLEYNNISMADFFKWNPAVGADCGNLWANTHACVGVIGGSSPTTKLPATTTSPGNGIKTPDAIQPGMVKNCNKFHLIKETTTCKALLEYNKISMADFYKWNPAVKSDCSGLIKGTEACVGVIGGSPPPTTTQPSNGIKTPIAIQPGMVGNCNKFHLVKETTTCQGILDYNKISLADFFKWNPAVKKDCSGLIRGTEACVGVIGGSTPTTTKPGNGVTTPTPIQPGMVGNCNKFHPVKETTTCQGILDYQKITLANFFKWNPAVKKDCSGLLRGTNACVGVM